MSLENLCQMTWCLKLELLDETTVAAACCQFYVHAFSGTEALENVRIRALVGSQVMLNC